MKGYLKEFTDRYDYPEKAKRELLEAYDDIARIRDAYRILTRNLLIYEKRGLEGAEWNRADTELALVSKYTQLHLETVHLLFCILLTAHLHRLYLQNGYSEALYDGAVLDLKWKVIECERMNGFTGIECYGWMHKWFTLGRFTLGRLQYQPEKASRVIKTDRVLLERGDLYLNMHIPSCGPLTREAVIDSYGQAKEFFASKLGGKPAVVQCTSWLLAPNHRVILPPSSNIRRFCEDFELYDWGKSETGGDLWRIFYRDVKNPPEDLPKRTTLERAYAELLASGERPGWGSGVLLPDDVKA